MYAYHFWLCLCQLTPLYADDLAWSEATGPLRPLLRLPIEAPADALWSGERERDLERDALGAGLPVRSACHDQQSGSDMMLHWRTRAQLHSLRTEQKTEEQDRAHL